jgi:signal transduction histidine kinase
VQFVKQQMNERIDLRAGTTPDSRWLWGAAWAFIILTLAALVVNPVLVQRRVDSHRSAVEASEPARTLLMSLRFDLVRERATLREFARTGDRVYADEFMAARTQERRDFEQLAPLARQLGGDVTGHFERARSLASFWHRELNEEEVLQRGPAAGRAVETPEMQRLFQEVLQSASQLDSAIVNHTRQVRADIERSERTGLALTFVSGALALLAAAAVGALVFRMGRLADESERRRRETAAALAESARAAEARTRLLRGITHDVKNPLGAAKGYAELLELGVKGSLHEEQQKLVKGMERSIDSALAIISDLLDLARADSGGISVQRVHTDLHQLVREAVEDHRAAADQAGHVLSQPDGRGELRVFTDPVRVRQVLDNLISNAIKYTPAAGRIVVQAEGNSRFTQRGRFAAIRVSDNGPGIPHDKREMIFNEFTRLDESGLKGHGLGLAIARRVARILGGDLIVADAERGATFVLTVPQRQHPDT